MNNEIPKETLEWLQEEGARDISKYKYYLIEGNMHYSEEYLKNTPLNEIKEGYENICKALKIKQNSGENEKTKDNYIKIYEGDIAGFELQKRRTAIFYKRHFEIEGEKFCIYVDKNEFDTLKEIFKQFSSLENFEHYRIQMKTINLFEKLDNEGGNENGK